MIEINKSLHGAKGKIKAVYLGTTPVVMYLGNQLLYDVDLDGEYVLMDIQDGDTVDSTIEAPVKSATLKGRTLVNLYQSKTVTFVGEGKFNVNKDKLIENNKYTLFYEVKENNNNGIIFVDHMQSNKIHTNNSYFIESSIGSHKELLTFKKQANYETNFNWWSDSNQTISIDNIILLEGDHTQEDIPYFTGMQSVNFYPDQNVTKLTWKTGKYHDKNGQLTAVNANKYHRYIDEYVEIMPNMVYRASGNNNYKNLNFYDKDKTHLLKVTSTTYLGNGALTGDIVATAPNNAKYLRYNMAVGDNLTESTIIYNDTIGIPLASTSISETYTHKMPVLKTTGKNLFDKENLVLHNYARIEFNTGNFIYSNAASAFKEYFDCYDLQEKPLTITSSSKSNSTGEICFYDKNKMYITGAVIKKGYETIIVPINAYYYRFSVNIINTSIDKANIQIECNKQITIYEPYKSNILTVNEPIELRGIGDVKDTIDCLTGEVTQRIGEIVLNGSEHWWFANSSDNPENLNEWSHSKNTWLLGVDFKTISSNTRPVKNTISDKYPVYYNYSFSDSEYFNIISNNNALLFRVRKDRFSDKSIVNFKSWLSQNPITIQYQFTTESIKTVDLSIVDQDNKIISTLNTFNDTTHFTIQGEKGKLQPVVSMEIACNPSQAISELSNKTEQLQQEQQELTEQVEQQELDTNNLQTATTDLEEV